MIDYAFYSCLFIRDAANLNEQEIIHMTHNSSQIQMLIITENMPILTWKDERGITQERLAYDLPRTDQRPFLQN